MLTSVHVAPGDQSENRIRFADVIALGVIDAVIAQQQDDLGVLDKFGHGLFTKAVCCLYQGFDEQLVIHIGGEIADERAVNLDVLDRELLQIIERGKSHAEIIQTECATQRDDFFHQRARRSHIFHGGRFSNLEDQA